MVQVPLVMYYLYNVKPQGPFGLDPQIILPHKDVKEDLYQQ